MVLTKVAAENSPIRVPLLQLVVREYDEERDKTAVEEMERKCELEQRGNPSLVTDLMGDPICRIRRFPTHVMLIAEYGEQNIVGVIRGCVKEATSGSSVFCKACLYFGTEGLSHAQEARHWYKTGHTFGRMVQAKRSKLCIHGHRLHKRGFYQSVHNKMCIPKVSHTHNIGPTSPCTQEANILDQNCNRSTSSQASRVNLLPTLCPVRIFSPKDIHTILSSHLNLGTFMALRKKSLLQFDPQRDTTLPTNFAILSVWNTKEVFKLQVKGVSSLTYACCVGARVLDAWLPWLRLPSFPNVFKQFGVHFMYGLHREGKNGNWLMKALCNFVHNMAREDDGCAAVVTEVSQRDPVREAIPHWRKLSWEEDMWCVKKLADQAKRGETTTSSDDGQFDWINTRSSSSVVFVDPRDF